jgi:signal transduction histidine kinase
VACALLGFLLTSYNVAQVRRGLVERGRAISEHLARDAKPGLLRSDVAALRRLGTAVATGQDVLYCRVFDSRGTLLVAAGHAPTGVLTTPIAPMEDMTGPLRVAPGIWEFQAPVSAGRVPPPQGNALRLPSNGGGPPDRLWQPLPEHAGTVTVGMSVRPLHDRRRLAFVTAALLTLLVACLGVLSSVLLMRHPLRTLATTAALVGECTEVAEQNTRFVATACHDLRSPLTTILAASDSLRQYGSRMTPEQQRERLQVIEKAVRRMTDLLEDVRRSAREAEAYSRAGPSAR